MEIKIYSTTAATEDNKTVDVAMPEGATVESLFSDASIQAAFDATEEELADAFDEIDGEEVPENFQAMIVKGALEEDKSYGFALDFKDDEDDGEEGVADGAAESNGEQTIGTVEVWLFGGLVTVHVPVVNNVTKVSDVMMSSEVLGRTNQTPEQVANSIIALNGQDVDRNMAHLQTVKDGDRVSLTARVAKGDGVC